jgi:hypothetical protein
VGELRNQRRGKLNDWDFCWRCDYLGDRTWEDGTGWALELFLMNWWCMIMTMLRINIYTLLDYRYILNAGSPTLKCNCEVPRNFQGM